MINNIHIEYPDCLIFVVGQKYMNDIQTDINAYKFNQVIMELNRGYYNICNDSNYLDFCTYVDIAIAYDRVYFAPHDIVPIYKGSDETTMVMTDWLHPNKAGYYSIAENIAGAIADKMIIN